MNLDDFKHPSGKLIQVGQGDIAYKAFVPNPLPPRLEWDSEVVQALSSADRALGELAGLGRSLPNPHLLIGPFLRREAVLSSRIEGTRDRYYRALCIRSRTTAPSRYETGFQRARRT